jgi:hypothetical protein
LEIVVSTELRLLEFRDYGPYGGFGSEAGEFAIDMLGELLKPKPLTLRRDSGNDPVSLDRSDQSAIRMLHEMNSVLHFMETEQEAELRPVYRAVARLHGALPFSEAERTWLGEKEWSSADMTDDLMGETAEIMSGGVLRVLQGRELVRRWWAWRRQTNEFAGQGSLDEACRQLGVLAERLVIERHWPLEYPDMRATLVERDLLTEEDLSDASTHSTDL